MSDGGEGGTSEKTYTRDEVKAMIAAEVRKTQQRFSDYDELKQAAEAAAGSKSQLDKIQEALDKANARAERAEADALRSAVAQELGLTAKQARRLSGATRDELLADGRELIEDLGIKPGSKDGAGNGAEGEGKPQDGAAEGDGAGTTEDNDDARTRAPRARPRESLRSGAAMSEPRTDEMDPRKLAESVAKRF